MKLDNEQQRQILLAMIDNSNFPGAARKAVFDLGEAVAKAELEPGNKAAQDPTPGE